jgi:predicted N-acetyltransferase YhbS
VTYESEIRTLNWPEDREALLEHIRLVHGPGDYDILARWYGSMPGFDPHDSFIIDGDNGEIAGHTMLIPRALQFGDSVLPAAEVGVVGTLDTYRGRGYATAMLDQAMESMTLRGDAISIIFGIPNFYERWGYEYAVGLHLTSYESSIETQHALEAGKWNQAHGHQRRGHCPPVHPGRYACCDGPLPPGIVMWVLRYGPRSGDVALANGLHGRHRTAR